MHAYSTGKPIAALWAEMASITWTGAAVAEPRLGGKAPYDERGPDPVQKLPKIVPKVISTTREMNGITIAAIAKSK